jgi:hypothetical protein
MCIQFFLSRQLSSANNVNCLVGKEIDGYGAGGCAEVGGSFLKASRHCSHKTFSMTGGNGYLGVHYFLTQKARPPIVATYKESISGD